MFQSPRLSVYTSGVARATRPTAMLPFAPLKFSMVGCSEYAAGGPVLAVIDRLTRQHPRMSFDVEIAPVLMLYRDLTERKIELVITRLVEFADRDNMTVENLFDDDIVTVAAAQNPLP